MPRVPALQAGPFLVEGILELDPQRGELTLRAERVERLPSTKAADPKRLTV